MSTIIQEPQKPKPAALPFDILNNDTAKIYTHLHPVLVLSLYAYKFQSIVADPVPALSETLLWLGILQVAYAAICLPPTGSNAAPVEKKKPGEKKRAAPSKIESGLNGKIIVSHCLPVCPGYVCNFRVRANRDFPSPRFFPSSPRWLPQLPSSPASSSSSAHRSLRIMRIRCYAQRTYPYSLRCRWYMCMGSMAKRGGKSLRC
jgi:hypothetical protein